MIFILFIISYGISAPYRKERRSVAIGNVNPEQSTIAPVQPVSTPEPTPPPLQHTAEPTAVPIPAGREVASAVDTTSLNAPGGAPSAFSIPEEDIPYEGFQEAVISLPVGSSITIDDFTDESPNTFNVVIDDRMPLLVNASHRLTELWKPDDLVFMAEYCPSSAVKIKGAQIQGDRHAVDELLALFYAAVDEGIGNWQVSAGYRSWAYQQSVFNDQVYSYQKEEGLTRAKAIAKTRQYVAEPGASEHHTGLAFDITVPGKTFASTPQCEWLAKHCWEYGFIVRYTSDKVKLTGIAAEPWHIRYVGRDAARVMTQNNWCLEEYVEMMAGV